MWRRQGDGTCKWIYDGGPPTAERPRGDLTTSRAMGLDVRYPLSGDLTLDVTLNTDFAPVEADDQQVNLDRFPLFYPERRRFFRGGAGSSTSRAAARTLDPAGGMSPRSRSRSLIVKYSHTFGPF